MPKPHYCIRCGQCCRVSGAWYPELKRPGTNICKHFLEPNICTIWETRPLICDAEQVFDELQKYVPRRKLNRVHKSICQAVEKIKPEPEKFKEIYTYKTRTIASLLQNSDLSEKLFDLRKPGDK